MTDISVFKLGLAYGITVGLEQFLKEIGANPGNGSYYFDSATGTLTVNVDDDSLSHKWNWPKMQYDVEALK